MFQNRLDMRVSERRNGATTATRTMRTSPWWWCVVVAVVVVLAAGVVVVSGEIGDYTHEWAVHVEGGDGVAEELARRHDCDVAYKVFDDVYVLRHRRLARRSADPSPHHHQRFVEDPAVRWVEQQQVKRRVKRDYLSHISRSSYPTAHLNDPKWPQMWYLNRGGSLDMNVQAAWAAGATGKGVVVTILDDGLEKDHPDLIKNYDPNASYDVNNHDPDPMPRYDLVDSNRHGTRCAGEVAADANNSICAVGVAYEASVGGVRMLDGDVTDAVEARSLALNPQHIDIYSASWGPDDDGKTVDGPGQLATRAFVEGIRTGRGGKGSIFIWASGNGGRDQDNCNCDGYTNSIWTLSISSATEKGQVPWYSEACSSTLATTYSSGSLGERQIITTDLHHSCTTSHTGTSASAPLAAGICALALQVNRDITWRDMQHIVVRTARPENLEAPDWQINGVGRRVSHRFGYGLMDTYGMVKLARNWTSVPTQRTCDVEAPHIDKLIPQKSFVSLELDVTDCPGVNFLEHVQAKVSLTADRRGDIEIYLSSPAGTKSTLLAQRPHDSSRSGFHNWPFMTVHMWGERPLGKWVLEVHNNGHFFTTGKAGMKDWSLTMYGTESEPGQAVPSLVEDQLHSHISHSDPSLHQVVDTTEGKTETRDPGSHTAGHSSTPSSAARPASMTTLPVPLEKALPVGCLRSSAVGACLECKKNLYIFNGQCLKTCSPGHYAFDPQQEGVAGALTCRSCHYSCHNCSGPQDYECTECWGDAELYSPSKGQNLCQPRSLLEAFRQQESWYKALIGVVVSLVLVVMVLGILVLRRGKRSSTQHTFLKSVSTNGSKSSLNGKLSYSRMPQEASDKLITSVPFHDLTTDEEEEDE